jgi:hypothetical protein
MSSRSSVLRAAVFSAVWISCLAAAPRAAAQAPDVKSKVEATYKLTKPTDDKSDIVTAGSILILQKDKIIMYATTNNVVPQNTYKDGKLSAGAFGVHDQITKIGGFFGKQAPQQAQVTTRYYVTGEKFWVTHIDYPADGIVFTLFTDAVNDVRYQCTLKFVYPKGVQLTSDQVVTLLGDVLKVQPDDDSDKGGDQNAQQQGGGDQQASQGGGDQQQAAPAEQAAPAQVEVGMTTDQVVGILGQPEKILTLPAKQIYVYKDVKITFIKGKVADMQ